MSVTLKQNTDGSTELNRNGTTLMSFDSSGVCTGTILASGLKTPINFNITGDVTGTGSFSGDGDFSINTDLNLANFASLKSYNGYQMFPSGIMLQWGSATVTATGTHMTANFPTAFPTACWRMVASDNGDGGTPNIFSIGAISRTQYEYDTNESTGGIGLWFAIGY
jgi:hypothetical protein